MRNLRDNIKPILNKILSLLLSLGIALSVITILNAAAPNPGHNFTEVSGNVAQGDLLYGSTTDTLSTLTKSTIATRYLANTGTSNNPAWSQVDLSDGVTNDLPFANLTQGSALSALGVAGNAAADVASIAASTDNQVLRRSGITLGFGAVNLASTDAVSGILAAANGGTGNGFFAVSGPAATVKTFTFPNADATVLTTNAAVTVAQGGTGLASAADDAVWVGDSGTSVTARALPSCSNGTTDKILYNTSTNSFSCGTDQTGAGGSPTPEATYTMYSTGRVMLTDGIIMDLFNAVGSGQVIRILEVVAFQRNSAGVTGIRAPIEIRTTSAVGTGGTAISEGKFDSTDTALNANITARTAPTGGATLTGGFLGGSRIFADEAHLGTGAAGSFPWFQSQVPLYVNRGNTSAKRIVLREGQGIACKWGVVVGTAGGLAACGITFQIGAATATEQPTYSWQSNSAGGASKKMIDIFNASGSGKILKITRINIYARQAAAVTGNITPYEVYRTSAVGTGGTTITADRYDTSDSVVPAQITARDAPTGGATVSGGALLSSMLGSEETGDALYYGHFQRSGNALNTPYVFDGSTTQRPLTIREGEGIVVQNGPLAGTGNTVIIVEGTLE